MNGPLVLLTHYLLELTIIFGPNLQSCLVDIKILSPPRNIASLTALVTRIKPYCFPTVFKRLISVGFQLLISYY